MHMHYSYRAFTMRSCNFYVSFNYGSKRWMMHQTGVEMTKQWVKIQIVAKREMKHTGGCRFYVRDGKKMREHFKDINIVHDTVMAEL